MKKANVTAYPYATVYGSISVPDDIDEASIGQYVIDHFKDVQFGEPDLDYCGTDMDIEIEMEGDE